MAKCVTKIDDVGIFFERLIKKFIEGYHLVSMDIEIENLGLFYKYLAFDKAMDKRSGNKS